jgi:hypothetical protein
MGWDRDQWQTAVNTRIKLWVKITGEDLLDKLHNISLSRISMFCGIS